MIITSKESLKKAIIEVQEEEKRKQKQAKCKHKNFTIYGHNLLGEGVCLDCGKNVPLYIVLRDLIARLLEIENKIESKYASRD